jgi:hypothetical protein
MTEVSIVLAIVGIGSIGIVTLTVFAFIHAHNAQRDANKLVELALGGRADEARIIARNASTEVSSLLDALGEKLSPPRRPSTFRDALMTVTVTLPLVTLATVGFYKIQNGAETNVAWATSLLFGFAVLVPLTFAAGFTILSVGRHSARLLRGSYVTLLARNVKIAFEAEIAEALRRGPGARDPRGE